jgi:hypothetical protein
MINNLIAAAALLISTQSMASVADLPLFFQAFEGRWSVQGQVHQLAFNGSSTDNTYRGDLNVVHEGDGITWDSQSDITDDASGTFTSNFVNFSLHGENLFVSTNGSLEPVNVTESTARSLTYKVRRADFASGRVYDFTFQMSLDSLAAEFSGHNTIELNGVVVLDEQYRARHW